jgi:hypothetical protein
MGEDVNSSFVLWDKHGFGQPKIDSQESNCITQRRAILSGGSVGQKGSWMLVAEEASAFGVG